MSREIVNEPLFTQEFISDPVEDERKERDESAVNIRKRIQQQMREDFVTNNIDEAEEMVDLNKNHAGPLSGTNDHKSEINHGNQTDQAQDRSRIQKADTPRYVTEEVYASEDATDSEESQKNDLDIEDGEAEWILDFSNYNFNGTRPQIPSYLNKYDRNSNNSLDIMNQQMSELHTKKHDIIPIADHNLQIDFLNRQIQNKEELIESLMRTLDEEAAVIKKYANDLEDLKTDNHKCITLIDNLENDAGETIDLLSDKENEISSLRDVLESEKELKKVLNKKLNDLNKQLLTERDEQSQKIEVLNKKISLLTTELKSRKQAMEKQNDKDIFVKGNNEEYSEDTVIADSNSNSFNLTGNNVSFDKELQECTLQSQLKEMCIQRDELMQNIMQLMKENEDLKSDMDRLKCEVKGVLEHQREETVRIKSEYEDTLDKAVMKDATIFQLQEELAAKTPDERGNLQNSNLQESESLFAELYSKSDNVQNEHDYANIQEQEQLYNQLQNDHQIMQSEFNAFEEKQVILIDEKDKEICNLHSQITEYKEKQEKLMNDLSAKTDDIRMLQELNLKKKSLRGKKKLSKGIKDLSNNVNQLVVGLDKKTENRFIKQHFASNGGIHESSQPTSPDLTDTEEIRPSPLDEVDNPCSSNVISTYEISMRGNVKHEHLTVCNDDDEKYKKLSLMLSYEQEQNCVLNEKLKESLSLYDAIFEQLTSFKSICNSVKDENKTLRQQLGEILEIYEATIDKDSTDKTQSCYKDVSIQTICKNHENSQDNTDYKCKDSANLKNSSFAVETELSLSDINNLVSIDKITVAKKGKYFSCHESDNSSVVRVANSELKDKSCFTGYSSELSRTLVNDSFNLISQLEKKYNVSETESTKKHSTKEEAQERNKTVSHEILLLIFILVLVYLIGFAITNWLHCISVQVFVCAIIALCWDIRQRYQNKHSIILQQNDSLKTQLQQQQVKQRTSEFSELFDIIEKQEHVIEQQKLAVKVLEIQIKRERKKQKQQQNTMSVSSVSERSTPREIEPSSSDSMQSTPRDDILPAKYDEIYTPRGKNIIPGVVLADFLVHSIRENVSFTLFSTCLTFLLAIHWYTNFIYVVVFNISVGIMYIIANRKHHNTYSTRIKKDSLITAIILTSLLAIFVPFQRKEELSRSLMKFAFCLSATISFYMVTFSLKLLKTKLHELSDSKDCNSRLKTEIQDIKEDLEYKTQLLKLKESYKNLNNVPVLKREDLDSIEVLIDELDNERKDKKRILDEKRNIHHDVLQSLHLNKKLTNQVTVSIGEINMIKDANANLRRELFQEQINVIDLKNKLKGLQLNTNTRSELNLSSAVENDIHTFEQSNQIVSSESSNDDHDSDGLSFTSMRPTVGTDVAQLDDFDMSGSIENGQESDITSDNNQNNDGMINSNISYETTTNNSFINVELGISNNEPLLSDCFDADNSLDDGFSPEAMRYTKQHWGDGSELHKITYQSHSTDNMKNQIPFTPDAYRDTKRQLSKDSGRGSLEVSQNLDNSLEEGEKLKQTELENKILEKEFHAILTKVLHDQQTVCNEVLDLTEYIENDRNEKLLLSQQVTELQDEISNVKNNQQDLDLQRIENNKLKKNCEQEENVDLEGNLQESKYDEIITKPLNIKDVEEEHINLEREFEETLSKVLHDQKAVCNEIMELTDHYEQDQMMLSYQVDELRDVIQYKNTSHNETQNCSQLDFDNNGKLGLVESMAEHNDHDHNLITIKLQQNTEQSSYTEISDYDFLTDKENIQCMTNMCEKQFQENLSLNTQAKQLRDKVDKITGSWTAVTHEHNSISNNIICNDGCGMCDHYAILILCYRENIADLEHRIANEKRKQNDIVDEYEKELNTLENVLIKKYKEMEVFVKNIEQCFQDHNIEQFQNIKTKMIKSIKTKMQQV